MGRRFLFFLFLFALLPGFSLGDRIRIPLAGVSGDHGVVTHVNISVEEGDGRIYSAILPFSAEDTQESLFDAVYVAGNFSGVNTSRFDVFFEIGSETESVEGPSAGAAVTLGLLSLFLDEEFPNDTLVTGSISRNGRIGSVGGIVAKARAASEHGFKKFIIPRGQAVQRVPVEKTRNISGINVTVMENETVNIIQYAYENYGLLVAEAVNVSDAFDYVFRNKTINVSARPMLVEAEEQFNVSELGLEPQKTTVKTSPLERIAKEELSEAERILREVTSEAEGSEKLPFVVDYLRAADEQIKAGKELLDLGYLYSAANYGFLARISVVEANLSMGDQDSSEFEDRISYNEVEIARLKEALRQERMNENNFEWIAAAQQRVFWAENQFEELEEFDGQVLPQDVYDIAVVEAWLDGAEKFLETASKINGTPFLESSLKSLAQQGVLDAEGYAESLPADLDEKHDFHLRAAKNMYSEEFYAGSVFNSYEAIAIADSEVKTKDRSDEELEEVLEQELGNDSSSGVLWYEIYYPHILFYKSVYETYDDRSSLISAIEYARRIKALAHAHESIILSKKTVPPGTEESVESLEEPVDYSFFLFILLVAVSAWFAMLGYRELKKETRVKKKAKKEGDYEKMLDELDVALIEGRVSEENYSRLRSKYEDKLKTSGPPRIALPVTEKGPKKPSGKKTRVSSGGKKLVEKRVKKLAEKTKK